MNTPRLFLGALAALAIVTCLTAQRTWYVDSQNRPGTDFVDLPPAIAAAVPGDFIAVRGTINGATISKGVTIYGDLRESGTRLRSSLVVRNLPTGQRFSLKAVHGTFQTYAGDLVLEDNQGQVLMEASDWRRTTITRCADVLMNQCWIDNVQIVASSVVAHECAFRTNTSGLEAVSLRNSHLTLAFGSVWGSAGVKEDALCRILVQPGPAMRATDSTLVVRGGQTFDGGSAYWPLFHPCHVYSVFAPDIVATNLTIAHDGLRPIRDIQGSYRRQVVSVSGWFFDFTGAAPGMVMSGQVWANPGDLMATLVSLPAQRTVTPVGDLYLDPTSAMFLDMGIVPPAPLQKRDISVPIGREFPRGLNLICQAISIGPSGFVISPPLPLIMTNATSP